MSKKLVQGVGVYEKGKYTAIETVDGKWKNTKVYSKWCNMLERGYCPKYKLKRPTYQGVTVCNDWLNFQTFAVWYMKQRFANKIDYHLDKDLLVSGNKIYSPETCVLLPQSINSALITSNTKKGNLPTGVSKNGNKFKVMIAIKGKLNHFGTFDNVYDAYDVYVVEKEKYVKDLAEEYLANDLIDAKTYNALINWKASGYYF